MKGEIIKFWVDNSDYNGSNGRSISTSEITIFPVSYKIVNIWRGWVFYASMAVQNG